ncbi:MAG TPA: hypothetical protein VMA35_12325, partial [Candidatus Sulfopaludibacter sp.]|nr:hypothetical protein [Candidatus Sulfopaludibacter sp.]
LIVCGLAISDQSYWIDEASTAVKAGQPTLAKWWLEMMAIKGSDLQMPCYMVFAWAWEKLVGLNEYALRAGNAPWFLLGLIATFRALNASRLQKCLALVALSSPLIWQYLNEARPYAMQIGMSSVVFFSLYRLGLEQKASPRERYWIVALCLGSLVLAASSMLAMLWLGAYWMAAMLSTSLHHLRRLVQKYWVDWALTLTLLFGVGLYYLWTLKAGGRAATLEHATGFKNVLFIFYELLGFSGLGPGRLIIRTGGLHSFLPWLPWLGIYATLLLPVLVLGWRRIAAIIPRRTLICWTSAFVSVTMFILAIGVAVGFRVLGRHCLPVLPPVLFLLAMGLAALWDQRNRAARGIGVAFLTLSLLSSLSLRFSERHAKDDYRDAAALGRKALARGESVWWSADLEGAEVYHLPVTRTLETTNAALVVVNPSEKLLKNLPVPDLVLVSKPDLYDGSGALANYLVRSGFQQTMTLSAFTAWQPLRRLNAPAGAARVGGL